MVKPGRNRDRIYINKSYRTFLNEWDDRNILDFETSTKIDIFLIAVALGLDNPKECVGARDGYFQLYNSVHTYQKALFGSILLGKTDNLDIVEEYANADVNYDEAEKCSESGFIKLKEIIEDANGNEELLSKRLLQELKMLYEKNVASNL